MEKIKTIFNRNPEKMQLVTSIPGQDVTWVFEGQGKPTRKRDGTNVRISVQSHKVVKVEKRKNPTREEKAQGAEPDYIEANRADPSDKHIFSAVDHSDFSDWPDGSWSCEALGQKIQGGCESKLPMLYNFSLKAEELPDFERTFEGIKNFLEKNEIEGVVWHHPDGRMAKIKRKDFGFKWPIK